jgi:hypothetical protein
MARASDSTLDAGLSGELAIRQDCLVVVDTSGAAWVVVWPVPGTIWDADPQTLVYHDRTFRPGDDVTVRGGEYAVTPETDFDWITRPSDGCFAQDGFWLAG